MGNTNSSSSSSGGSGVASSQTNQTAPSSSLSYDNIQQHRRDDGHDNNTSDVFLFFLREKVSIQHEKRSSSAHDCLTNVPSSLSSSFLLPSSSLDVTHTCRHQGGGARARKSDDVDDAMTSRADGRRERRFIYGICTTR